MLEIKRHQNFASSVVASICIQLVLVTCLIKGGHRNPPSLIGIVLIYAYAVQTSKLINSKNGSLRTKAIDLKNDMELRYYRAEGQKAEEEKKSKEDLHY